MVRVLEGDGWARERLRREMRGERERESEVCHLGKSKGH